MDTVDLSDNSQPLPPLPPASPAAMAEPTSLESLSQSTSTPAPASSTSPLAITIHRAQSSDSPAIALLEMTAFVEDPISQHMNPLRRTLVASGAHPSKWPDYPSVVKKRERSFATGQWMFKAVVPNEDGGGEKIVGMALVTPPRRLLWSVSVKELVLGSVVYPAVDALRRFVPTKDKARGEGTGLDEEFAHRFHETLEKTRKEVMGEREHIVLNLLFASSTYPRSGIGSALLTHIIALANAAHLPLILESTRIAMSLYAKHGFEVVKQSRMEGKGPEDVVEWPVMVREPVGGYVQGGEAGEGTVEVESLASD